jgi:prephenate dehydrogenase
MTSPSAAVPCTAVVIGTGLIGTSVALGLRARGGAVHLRDADPLAAERAADLGAGTLTDPDPERVDLVLVAVPPAGTVATILAALDAFPRATVTDVASVKAPVLAGVAGHRDSARFVGGHPLAGREVSGPAGARSDLFEGRAWVLAPEGAEPGRFAQVRQLVADLGATPIEMAAANHDRAVALVSHVPQLMASLTAARLSDADPTSVSVAGQGLRDVTRIAASDPGLWADIVGSNQVPVLEILEDVLTDLTALVTTLRAGRAEDGVHDLVARGNAGHARIPGKHGDVPQRYTDVPVVIPDRPGALAALFELAGRVEVNIEDLALEHSPGQPVGLATLRVLPARASALVEALRDGGWTVHA